MRKVFTIKESKHAPARQVDQFKHEIKKYIARERRRDLPEGADYWDFQCKIGPTAQQMQVVHSSQINSALDQLIALGRQEFCVEVVAVPGHRKRK
jgi:hypothetical protein